MRRKSLYGTAALAAAIVVLAALFSWRANAEEKPSPSLSLEQARREVRMLDDLYKTAIVYINEVYVEDADSVAAGETARDLFAAMRKKGWHDARLVDVTGEPLNEENVARDAFEKAAVAKILAGETYYDTVERDGDHEVLRAATLVPVVNDKCVICHPGNKVGDALGIVSYKLPLK